MQTTITPSDLLEHHTTKPIDVGTPFLAETRPFPGFMPDHLALPVPMAPEERGAILAKASRAELNATAVSDAAKELTECLLDGMITFEMAKGLRKRRPKSKDRNGLHRAIEGFTCDLILGQGHTASSGFVYRAVGRDFETTRTTKKTFSRVYKTWKAMGWIEVFRGFQQHGDFEGSSVVESRVASRFRASSSLMTLCRKHCITPKNLWDHYTVELSDIDAVVIRKDDGAMVLSTSAEYEQQRKSVELINKALSQHSFSFPRRPQLKRSFRADQDGRCDYRTGGRFFSLGADSYQQMKRVERAKIEIDGHPTVEVDVKASHPTIAHHLLQANEPLPTDPYDIPGYPREVIKTATVIAFGKGGPPSRWRKDQKDELAALYGGDRNRVPRVTQVWNSIVKALPFLERLEEGITDWGIIQYLEAEALRTAMERLWDQEIPSLPVHDSLIVPAWASNAAREAIIDGYERVIGVTPRVVES